MSVKIEDIQESISNMSDTELLDRIRAIRGRRDADVPAGQRTKSKPNAKEVKFTEALKGMSQEDIQKLLIALTGGE